MQASEPQRQMPHGSHYQPGLEVVPADVQGGLLQHKKPDGTYYEPGLEMVPQEVHGGLQHKNPDGSYYQPGLQVEPQPQKPDGSYYEQGLEMVPQNVHGGLQHTEWANTPMAISDAQADKNGDFPESSEHPRTQRICGLKRRTFWMILVIVLVIVIGAGVGAGVGASTSNKKSSDAASKATKPLSPPSTTNPSSTTSSPFPLQTITSPKSSRVLIRDCPSSNNTLYTYTTPSTSLTYHKRCSQKFHQVTGHDEHTVNEYVQTLDICIEKCAQHNINNRDAIAAGNIFPCSAVCWRNTFETDFPGHCFGFQTRNLTNSEESPDDTRFDVSDRASRICDGAAWIDPF